MVQRFFFIFLYSILQTATFAQSNLKAALDEFVSNPDLEGAAISVSVKTLNTGRSILSHQANIRLTPASIQKLVVTSAALDILGPEFQFVTKLGYTGFIDSLGTLHGDLIITGGGDPSLGSAELEEALGFDPLLQEWQGAVKDLGVKKINGRIIGDGSRYSGYFAGPGWPWEDLGNYYGAGVWGLNIQENAFDLEFQLSNTKSVGPKLLGHTPGVPNLLLINELETGDEDSGDQAYIFGGPFSYKRWIRGSLPKGTGSYSIHGSIPDPAYFAAFHLKNSLSNIGIKSGIASTQIDIDLKGKLINYFHEVKSPVLRNLVKAANYESINLYCEIFLREICENEKSGVLGLEYLNTWLESNGIDPADFILKDGSGLAPQNAISASGMTALICNRSKDQDFVSSLPVGGISGTAKYIFRNSPAKGKLVLKSGSMSGVRAYAGIAKPGVGEPLAVCVIANNFNCKSSTVRRAMEKFMEQLVVNK